METIIEEEGKTAIVTLKGRLETTEAAEVQDKVSTLYEKDLERVIVECKDLEYVASSGLRILFLLLRTMKPKGADVVIRNSNDMLKAVFDSTGFTPLFKFE
jgi:anti-anti-sigma factor